MAVSLCQRYFPQYLLNKCMKSCTQFVKWKSDAHIAMTDDTSTVVCWHPEKHFPYEMSLPLPKKCVPKSDSVLKVQSNKELLSVFKPKRNEVVVEELTKMTYTTKHIWFPRKRRFKVKEPVEMDRPYL